jgi:hypothetical protein
LRSRQLIVVPFGTQRPNKLRILNRVADCRHVSARSGCGSSVVALGLAGPGGIPGPGSFVVGNPPTGGATLLKRVGGFGGSSAFTHSVRVSLVHVVKSLTSLHFDRVQTRFSRHFPVGSFVHAPQTQSSSALAGEESNTKATKPAAI